MSESQLRKGAVELVVLGLLSSRPSYGGQLVERFREEAGLEISTGTLYPLLARLRKSGLVVTAWEESPIGLLQMRREWEALDCAVKRTTQKGIQ